MNRAGAVVAEGGMPPVRLLLARRSTWGGCDTVTVHNSFSSKESVHKSAQLSSVLCMYEACVVLPKVYHGLAKGHMPWGSRPPPLATCT
jgi:hypothetical protein